MAISFATAGGKGLLGALLATVVVIAFFGAGQLALARFGRNNPQMLMASAMLVYTTQILVIGVLLAVAKHLTFFDHKVFGISLLALVVIWMGFQVRGWLKAKTFYVEPDGKPKSGRQP
ncbi:hypothetical protein [Kitasatospora phosalacinea]|uniref:hypothetical protein n=1 Tax=Kitasatospora phosalacinea TaxID=2065 RepID=UPI000B02AB95|nr:hypothetical protein [Kitasatospora phosalacinea]